MAHCFKSSDSNCGNQACDAATPADALRAEAEKSHARFAGAQAPASKAHGCRKRHACGCDVPPPDDFYDSHGEPHHRRHGHFARRLRRKLICIVVLLLVVIAALLIIWPRINRTLSGAFTPSLQIQIPESLNDLLPDAEMGYHQIDFSNAILGESREKQELVVMEQDVEVTSQISQELLNISFFSKAKIIRSYGTGVYTVALSKLTVEDIAVDMDTKIITVTVPHTQLSYIDSNAEKTELEDTQKAWLAVGDIKLTQEQQKLLDQSVDSALRDRLNQAALFTKADEIALTKVRELYQPLVSAISDEFIVKIIMPAD